MKTANKSTKIIIPTLAAISLIVPLFLGNNYFYDIFIMAGVYTIIGSGMNLLLGFTGQLSMGHAAFYGFGAYITAIGMKSYGVPFWACVLLSVLFCFVTGMLLGSTSCKLSGIFLVVVTTGFNTIVNLILVNWDFTGKSFGIPGIPKIKLFGSPLTKLQYCYLILLFVFLALFVSYRIVKSKTGRAFQAMRDNPIAASSVGVNVSKYKLLVFAVSAVYAGVAGALYASNIGYISPTSFNANVSVTIITMTVLGGLGDLAGCIVGAIVVGVLMEVLRKFGAYQLTIYGLLIVVILIFMPKGIMGAIRSIYGKIASKLSKSPHEAAANEGR